MALDHDSGFRPRTMSLGSGREAAAPLAGDQPLLLASRHVGGGRGPVLDTTTFSPPGSALRLEGKNAIVDFLRGPSVPLSQVLKTAPAGAAHYYVQGPVIFAHATGQQRVYQDFLPGFSALSLLRMSMTTQGNPTGNTVIWGKGLPREFQVTADEARRYLAAQSMAGSAEEIDQSRAGRALQHSEEKLQRKLLGILNHVARENPMAAPTVRSPATFVRSGQVATFPAVPAPKPAAPPSSSANKPETLFSKPYTRPELPELPPPPAFDRGTPRRLVAPVSAPAVRAPDLPRIDAGSADRRWTAREASFEDLSQRLAAVPPSEATNPLAGALAETRTALTAGRALLDAVTEAQRHGRGQVVRGSELLSVPAALEKLAVFARQVDSGLASLERGIAAATRPEEPAIPPTSPKGPGTPRQSPIPKATPINGGTPEDAAAEFGVAASDVARVAAQLGVSPDVAAGLLAGRAMRSRGSGGISGVSSSSQASEGLRRPLADMTAEEIGRANRESLGRRVAGADPRELQSLARERPDLMEAIVSRLFEAFSPNLGAAPGIGPNEAAQARAGLVGIARAAPEALLPPTVFTRQRIDGIESDPRTRIPEVAQAVERAAAQWPNGIPSARDLTTLHMERYISVRTGLPNGDAVPLMMREGDRVAVLSFAGIKNWNDDKAIGHHGADTVIAGFGRMLSRLFPGSVAHVGGDTFALVLRGDHIEGSVERLRDFMSRVGAAFTDDTGNRHVIHGWDILTTGIGDDLESARQDMGRRKEEMIARGTYPARGARAPSAAVYAPGDPQAPAVGQPIVPIDGVPELVRAEAERANAFLFDGPGGVPERLERRDSARYRLRGEAQRLLAEASRMSPAERTRAGRALLAERYFAPGGGGLLNKTAWDELPHDRFTALVDVNALGAINKIMGLEAGDAMLDHVRQAFQRVLERFPGLRVYWLSGDEFGITGGDRSEVEAAAAAIREDLASRRIEVTVGGERIIYEGISFSYGLVENDMSQPRPHPNEVAVDAALQRDKERQVGKGLRLPAGSTDDPPGMRRIPVGGAPSPQSSLPVLPGGASGVDPRSLIGQVLSQPSGRTPVGSEADPLGLITSQQQRDLIRTAGLHRDFQPYREQDGLLVGGVNAPEVYRSLRTINGLDVDALEREMRPASGSQNVFASRVGFIADGGDLRQILASDAERFAANGVTPQQVAAVLGLFASWADRNGSSPLSVNGRTYTVSMRRWADPQPSPFRDGTGSAVDYTITDQATGDTMLVSGLSIEMLRRYGFAGGPGTPYRLDPDQTSRFLQLTRAQRNRP